MQVWILRFIDMEGHSYIEGVYSEYSSAKKMQLELEEHNYTDIDYYVIDGYEVE